MGHSIGGGTGVIRTDKDRFGNVVGHHPSHMHHAYMVWIINIYMYRTILIENSLIK